LQFFTRTNWTNLVKMYHYIKEIIRTKGTIYQKG
jgi:hypothetical protein